MAEQPGDRRFSRLEWAFLGLIAMVVIYYAVITEVRSCFLERRMTDFGVYLRAAWAARTGNDMYSVTDDNNWHYCYPPTFAILLMPLADPPKGMPRAGYLPYPISVGLWIILSYVFAAWAVEILARLLITDARRGSRRWWSGRTGPLLLTAGPIGYTIVHGQVNTLVALLVATSFAAWARGRKIGSGMWMAGAMALKVVPGFLVLFSLSRLDRRMLAGIVFGAILLLGVVPACVFGVSGAIRENRKLIDQVLVPGTTGAGDQTRAYELTRTTATDSHSFQAVIHNYLNPDPYTRPADASKTTRLIHWGICAAMTLITLLVGWRAGAEDLASQLVYLGSFLLIMVLASPVSHVHHYAMALPAISGVWIKGLLNRPGHAWPLPWVWAPLVLWCAGTGLPLFETGVPPAIGRLFTQLREFGAGTFTTVLVWVTSLALLATPRGIRTPDLGQVIGHAAKKVSSMVSERPQSV